MNNELGIMNKIKKEGEKNSFHNSCFPPVLNVIQHVRAGIIHNSAAPRRRGFALMFAILASTVLLSISVAIWNIALREVTLSSFGRESQVAFYSADSAAECAMYWDIKGAFATSTDTILYHPAGLVFPSPITCDGVNFITPDYNTTEPATDRSAVSTFSIGNGACARVIVTKNNPNGESRVPTRVEAFGRNSCDISAPTLVERGVRINYKN